MRERMYRHAHAILSILLLLVLFSGTASAGPRIAIIVNAQNQQDLSLQDVTNIYNDKVIMWENGAKIDVYNLPTSSHSRQVFSHAVLGLSAVEAAAAESNRRITNTSRNPQLLKRERLVKLAVGADKNAIGYITASNLGNKRGIRVLFTLE
jgi:ABC-type phosphate transport system substrate-binding protein